jgi:hypothetical protein
MTTFYRVYEDEVVGANSAEELVDYLARTSKMPVDAAGFRERAAFWLEGLWGEKIRTETDEAFVEDMLAIGRYQVVEKH